MQNPTDLQPTTRDAAAADDRRTATNPAHDPRPVNPPRDDDAVRKGQEVWDRVKAY